MKIIERINIPGMPNGHEQNEQSLMSLLWKQYGFPGQPPKDGSVAANRLAESCRQYANLIQARQSSQARRLEDIDPENFRPQAELESFVERQTKSSDQAQRDLHNQISIMIFGEARSGMEEHMAMQISRFAQELASKKD